MPSLIDALVTAHKFKITQGSGQTSAGFSNTGAGGLSMGSSTKIITRQIQNQAVLGFDELIQPSGHGVEGLGQFIQLPLSSRRYPVCESPPGNMHHAFFEPANGGEHTADGKKHAN